MSGSTKYIIYGIYWGTHIIRASLTEHCHLGTKVDPTCKDHIFLLFQFHYLISTESVPTSTSNKFTN